MINFKSMFRETEDVPMIHSEWLKAEYALGKAETEDEKAVIKAIAVIRMLHREDELPAQDQAICLALGMDPERSTSCNGKIKKRWDFNVPQQCRSICIPQQCRR